MGETIDAIIRLMAQKDASVDAVFSATERTATEMARRTSQTVDNATSSMGISSVAQRISKSLRDPAIATAMNDYVSKTKKATDESAQAVEKSSGRIKKSAEGTWEKLESSASKMALIFGGAAAGIALVGRAMINNASQMEQYRAKLETVLHSSRAATEAMQHAVKFAAETPFDVKGIVDATTQLTVYGANAKQVLPLVANLAAGMGKGIEETALVMAKAWSGSLEGFESLRNEYGISITKLKEYGASVDSQGQLQLKTRAEIDQTREALTRIINLDFSGATARQMDTFGGAMSNLNDAVTRLLVTLGERLVPALTGAAKYTTQLIEKWEAMPPVLKDLIVYSAGAAGGIASVGSTIMGGIALYASGTKAINDLTAGKLKLVGATKALAAAGAGEKAAEGASGIASIGKTASGIASIGKTAAGIASIGKTAEGIASIGKTASGISSIGKTSEGIASIGKNAEGIASIGKTSEGSSGKIATLIGFLTNLHPVVKIVALAATALGAAGTYAFARYSESQTKIGRQLAEESQEFQQTSQSLRFHIDILNQAGQSQGIVVQRSSNLAEQLRNIQDALGKVDLGKLRDIFASAGMQSQDIITAARESEDKLKQYEKNIRALRDAEKNIGFDASNNRVLRMTGVQSQNQSVLKAMGLSEKSTEKDVIDKLKGQTEKYQKELASKAAERKLGPQEEKRTTVLTDIQKQSTALKSYNDLAEKLKGPEAYVERLRAAKDNSASIMRALMDTGKGAGIGEGVGLLKEGTYQEALEKYKTAKNQTEKDLLKAYLEAKAEEMQAQKTYDDNRRKADDNIIENQFTAKKRAIEDEASLDHISIDEKYDREKELAEKLRSITQRGLSAASTGTFNGQKVAVGGTTKPSGALTKAEQQAQDELDKLRHDYATDPEVKKKIDTQLEQLDKGAKSTQKESQRKHLEELNLQTEQYIADQKILHENDTQAQIEDLKKVVNDYEEAMRKKLITEDAGQKQIQKYRIDTAQLTKKMADEDLTNQLRITKSVQSQSDIKLKALEKELAAGKNVQKEISDEVDKRLKKELEAIDIETQQRIKASDKTQKALQAIEMDANNSRIQAVEKAKSYLDGIVQQTKTEAQKVRNALESNTNPIQFTEAKSSGGWEAIPAFSGYGYKSGEEMHTQEPVSAMAHPDKTSAFGGSSAAEQKSKEYETVIDKATKALSGSITSVSDALSGLAKTITGVTNNIATGSGGKSAASTGATSAVGAAAGAASGAGAAAGAASKATAGSSSPAQIAGFSTQGFQGLNMEQASRSITNQATNQAISNTFMFGGTGFTPPADISQMMSGLMARLDAIRDGGFLGGGFSIGKLSY
ncbi:MAG: hypothetical protein AB2L14_25280 [Candidatus Xenobiia bacterium LiM19]